MKMHTKHILACAACAIVIVVAVLAGLGYAGFAIGALMCGAMMGAMVWMMVRGMRGSGGQQH